MKQVKNIRIVSRNNPLSLIQAKELLAVFPAFDHELQVFSSFGDKNRQVSLMENSAADFFTRELDTTLLNGEADIYIHSAKDLSYPLPAGLELFCLTEAADKTDSLVSKCGLGLAALPTGSRIGTDSKARKEELLKLRPDLEVVSISGSIQEHIAQVDNGFVDGFIVASFALHCLGLSHRAAESLPFKTHPLQGSVAVIGRTGDSELKDFFSLHDIRKNWGKVTLVGFGPGNADLLTIGGDKALANADVVFYDDLLDKHFLEKYTSEKVYVGKRKGQHSHHQDEINELLYQAAVSGKNVVRLKGGDPMVFAHGREEIDFLQSRLVEADVIPGVTSALALSALTHIPLTHRDVASSVAFVTGHSAENVAKTQADTLVIYMGGSNIAEIARKLIQSGRRRQTSVALVHNISLPDQKTFYSSLNELQNTVFRFPTPILIVVGDVVDFEKAHAPQENILVTGSTAEEYATVGNVVHSPLIKIEKNKDKQIASVLSVHLNNFDWIVFTSCYGVRYFFEILDDLRIDIRRILNAKIASVGKKTAAELKKYRLYPDIESPTESAEGLVDYFKNEHIAGKNILLPRSDKALKYLPDQLRQLGNRVTDLSLYLNTTNEEAKRIDTALFPEIVFASPSCVEAFPELHGKLPENVRSVAKGSTTKNKIKEALNETI
ncbi:MAG: hydroxymethylbilane synthase/uroporphyrin-III C-methyltransferase/uroporphyrinogen-III synthase [Bacteroidetes bacterium]|nr:hydroxymethylbilane synthase/uroporphyrin-III C-methyltransferase/uroporphyrinogen-III synthase [Bacteroidota bacterium]